jgi:inactivated superfamily I helicase
MPDMNAVPATPAVPPVEGTAPAAPVEGAKPVVNERMYKVKVNGKEEEWPESKVIERAQKSEGAEAAMQKAAQLDKAFTNFVAQAQNPEQLLTLLAHPSMKYDEEKQEMLVKAMLNSKKPRIINAVKEWIYKNEIEPKTMDPKDLELRELKAYKEQQEKERQAKEDERTAAEKEMAVKKAWDNHRSKIGAEIKAQGLPQTEATVARVARYALLYSRAGKPVDHADCVKRVKADLIAEANERFTSADDDNILDQLPEGMAERINKALMKRLKAKESGSGKPEGTAPAESGVDLNKMMKDLGRGKKVF